MFRKNGLNLLLKEKEEEKEEGEEEVGLLLGLLSRVSPSVCLSGRFVVKWKYIFSKHAVLSSQMSKVLMKGSKGGVGVVKQQPETLKELPTNQNGRI